MECPRGSATTESSHEIKTIAGALEWIAEPKISDLPLTIHQQTAQNGRVQIQVRANDGRLIEKRG